MEEKNKQLNDTEELVHLIYDLKLSIYDEEKNDQHLSVSSSSCSSRSSSSSPVHSINRDVIHFSQYQFNASVSKMLNINNSISGFNPINASEVGKTDGDTGESESSSEAPSFHEDDHDRPPRKQRPKRKIKVSQLHKRKITKRRQQQLDLVDNLPPALNVQEMQRTLARIGIRIEDRMCFIRALELFGEVEEEFHCYFRCLIHLMISKRLTRTRYDLERDSSGCTLLMLLCQKKWIFCLGVALDTFHFVDLSVRNSPMDQTVYQGTALHFAVSLYFDDCVTCLVNYLRRNRQIQAIHALDSNGQSALSLAVANYVPHSRMICRMIIHSLLTVFNPFTPIDCIAIASQLPHSQAILTIIYDSMPGRNNGQGL